MYVYFQMMKYHSSKMRVFLLVIKTRILRTVGILHLRKSAVHGKPQNFLLKIFLNPSFTIAWNIYGRNRIKNIYFTKIIQISDKANLDLIHFED